MRERRILAFDQTLTNTGWVLFEAYGDEIQILRKGTLKCQTTLNSHESLLDKADQLEIHLYRLTERVSPLVTHDFMVVMERPAVAGFRTESSLMAAREVARMCDSMNWPWTMVANNTMKKFLGLKTKSKKSEVRDALMKRVDVSSREWNEHSRDALALGLTYVEKERV